MLQDLSQSLSIRDQDETVSAHSGDLTASFEASGHYERDVIDLDGPWV